MRSSAPSPAGTRRRSRPLGFSRSWRRCVARFRQMSPLQKVELDWPALDPAALSDWIGRAINIELAAQLSKIKERQQLFLRRELNRIDEYFENYARELRERTDRQHKEEAIKR